jgi:hypothetical protein
MRNVKSFNVKIPTELWSFLKKDSVEKQQPMNAIITVLLKKYKNKEEKGLTLDDA